MDSKSSSSSECKSQHSGFCYKQSRDRHIWTTVFSALGWSLFVLFFLFYNGQVHTVQADPATTVTISPSPLTIKLGETGTVSIYINNVVNLYGVDIRLSFDPAKLEVVDADPGKAGVQMTPGDFPQPDFLVRNVADNTAGTITYAVTQMNPTPEKSGSGIAFQFTLRGLSDGTSTLHFTQVTLADRNGSSIYAVANDGTVNIGYYLKIILPLIYHN
jgi:hypothetical protein